jgi:hypothetical protein
MFAPFRRLARSPLSVVLGSAALVSACSDSPIGPSALPAASPAAAASVAPPTTPAPAPAPTTPPQGPVNITAVGLYALVSVNGRPVPGPFDSFSPTPSVRMEMHATRGHVDIRADGTFTQEWETRLTGTGMPGAAAVKTVTGSYTLQGTSLTFQSTSGATYSPAYGPGWIEVVTEAPGLNGGTDRFVWRFQR